MNLRNLGVSLVAIAVLAGCSDDFGDTGDGGSSAQGNVRLVNASQSGFLDLYQSDAVLNLSVALNGAGSFASLKSGSRTLDVRTSGSTTVQASANLTVVKNDHQALVAYQSAGKLAATALSEDEADPTSTNAKLRVLNTTSADAGNVDVYVVDAATSCAQVAGAATAASFSTAGFDASPYVVFPATATAYRVCVTGPGDRAALRLDIPSLLLTNLRVVTLVLTHTPAGALQALTIDRQATVAAITGTATAAP